MATIVLLQSQKSLTLQARKREFLPKVLGIYPIISGSAAFQRRLLISGKQSKIIMDKKLDGERGLE